MLQKAKTPFWLQSAGLYHATAGGQVEVDDVVGGGVGGPYRFHFVHQLQALRLWQAERGDEIDEAGEGGGRREGE